MYEYKCKLLRVVDGDTCVMDLDLGFTVHVTVTFRLFGINAPEPTGKTKSAGLAAKTHLEELFANCDPTTLIVKSEKSLKTDKYGRWLATFTATNTLDKCAVNINQQMLLDGFAVASC